MLKKDIKNIFLKSSVATICTALFKKGLRNQFVQGVNPLNKKLKNMVGYAYTVRYIPAREDLNSINVFENPKHPQRMAIEECPKGYVLIFDSRKDPKAASAGAILITRLMKRGCEGIVTDGGFRDSPEIEKMDFPAYHQRPSSPTNLTLHQAIDINVPIGCGDVAVWPNDLIVGDQEGVVIIPSKYINEISEDVKKMTIYENFVMNEVRKGKSIRGLYPLTDEKIKKKYENTMKEQIKKTGSLNYD